MAGAGGIMLAFLRRLLTLLIFMAAAAGFVGSLLGLGAALMAARWPAGRLARLLDFICALGLVLPSFVLGPLLIWIFAVVLGWLPSGELHGIASYPLPVLALSAGF